MKGVRKCRERIWGEYVSIRAGRVQYIAKIKGRVKSRTPEYGHVLHPI